MANFIEYLKRIKPVYRHSSNRMKICIITAIVLGIVCLFALRTALVSLNQANDELASQAAALVQENDDLEYKLSIQGTKEAVIQIAREILGLVTPDTVIVQPEG